MHVHIGTPCRKPHRIVAVEEAVITLCQKCWCAAFNVNCSDGMQDAEASDIRNGTLECLSSSCSGSKLKSTECVVGR